MKYALAIVAMACGATHAAIGLDVPAPAHGLGTVVVTLAPHTATAVVTGPFAVTAINPGTNLALAIGSAGCSGALAWFDYSGGGVAVATDRVLCARSSARSPVTHGFSGRAE